MKVIATNISDLLIMEPEVFTDKRGLFFESYSQLKFEQVTGLDVNFVQDNHSSSGFGVLRGLHYQYERPQGKLIRVTRGKVFSVAVDLRVQSNFYGKWVGVELSADNFRQLWIPVGFAHGFLVLSDSAELLYKTTDYYFPDYERSIRWNDENLNIQWPLNCQPILSDKDQNALSFLESEKF